MRILFEYLFCFLYVSGVFVCIFPYLEVKRSKVYVICFLIIYSLFDFVITRDYFLLLNEYMISNTLVILSDFFMICIYEKKFSPRFLFYTTLYFCIYSILVNFMTYYYISIGLSVIDMYHFSVIRALMVLNYIGISVGIFKCLEKMKVIPSKDILENHFYIFDIINIIVLFSFLIFFGFSLIEIDTFLIIFIFLFFIILWLGLLLLMNKAFGLMKENNDLVLLNMANNNSALLIENYQKENEEAHKMHHDMKNHFQIIRESKSLAEVRSYIDEIIGDNQQIANYLCNTGNKTVDTVLSLKMVQYPEVKFIIDVEIDDLFIGQKDIASILFNLIDNAIENGSTNQKNVSVKIIQQYTTLVIDVVNFTDKKPTFISTKGFNHGYGLKIIKSICSKYNGDFHMVVENEMVIAEVVLEKEKF